MGLKKIKLGELIVALEDRNGSNIYGEEAVVGLSTQKEIIKTKADLSNVSLTSYKLFPPKTFAYVPDTSRRGEKMSMAYNTSEDTYLVSSISVVFMVKEEEILLSDYLFMYFNRPEFDRYSRFNSWGSAREVFSWDEMCDIEIELPSLQVQKKFVNVYNSMLENQRNYERGLEDLKLTIDIQIDKLKSNAKKFTISDLLEEIDNRNTDGKVADIQGINITKQFMKSVADTTNLNLSRYKIVEKNQFAYSGMQTGRDECIRISLYTEEKPIIISPAYSVLQVKAENILPEYIMMWFSRKEIDRMGWFMSDSSIRSNLDMDRFFEMKVPVPDMVIQKSLVSLYKAYVIRRGINEKLKTQIKDICPILIKGSLERN